MSLEKYRVAPEGSGFVLHSFPEDDFPMTMQVGMVGADGIVLASDKRWGFTGSVAKRLWVGANLSCESTKLRVSERRGIAIACAADMVSSTKLALAILEKLDDRDVGNPSASIESIARETIRTIYDANPPQLLLMTKEPRRLYTLRYLLDEDGKRIPQCLSVDNVGITGHCTNAALFYAERYMKDLVGMPVERLIPLAAHIIVSAGILNPAGVAGLEIMYCKNGNFVRLSDEQNREWELRSLNWDKQIGELITAP